MQKSEIQIVWFKRDLRITDHKPLFEASKILKPILMTFLTTTAVKRLVVDLLKSIAKQTTNTLDDKAVAILEKQLFPPA